MNPSPTLQPLPIQGVPEVAAHELSAPKLHHAGLVPRLRLDISWPDLAAGATACLTAVDTTRRARRIAARFGDDALVAYSVRSAFDAYLAEVDWPRGSQVLVSALTIPDMVRIIEHHGYVPVPVDLDLDTMCPSPKELERAMGPRTVAWLHAHLFGTLCPLEEHVALCRRHGVQLIEDRAQAWTGDGNLGVPGAAVVLFSFGTIKTAAALGGAVIRVADPLVRRRVAARMARWPVEPRSRRVKKVTKCSVLHALSSPVPYAALTRALRLMGRDPDSWVHGAVRGFGGASLFTAIRHRPSAPLLALLERRVTQDITAQIARRAEAGELVRAQLPSGIRLLGSMSERRTHWVVAIVCDDPHMLASALRREGFDATSRSSLAVPEGGHTDTVDNALERLVYLPVEPATVDALCDSLQRIALDNELGRLLAEH